jgi:hypothetical protein
VVPGSTRRIRRLEAWYDFADGTRLAGLGDFFDIPPGHDGYTVGDEPCVQIEEGIRAWAAFRLASTAGSRDALHDLVDSTARATELEMPLARASLSALRRPGRVERFEAAR